MMHRAASVTAAIFALVAAGLSTPGFGAELDRTAMTTARLVSPITTQILPVVPALPTSDAGTDAPATVADGDEPAVPHFASLQAAIDAQDAAVTGAAMRCLAAAVYFEAKGEPIAGQLAVAEVIINRTKSGRFPSDLCDVVTQPGQFSFVHDGEVPTLDAARPAYRRALAIAKVALEKAWDSPAPAALFFHARRVAPGWGKAQVAAIGNHVFYR